MKKILKWSAITIGSVAVVVGLTALGLWAFKVTPTFDYFSAFKLLVSAIKK